MKRINKRIMYLCIFILLFLVEFYIAKNVHDNFVRPYVGDMLVTILLYIFIRIFIVEGVKLLPLYVFIFAAFVEILQYFNLVSLLHLQNNSIACIILGSTFDIYDILCYGAGCIVVFLIEKLKS